MVLRFFGITDSPARILQFTIQLLCDYVANIWAVCIANVSGIDALLIAWHVVRRFSRLYKVSAHYTTVQLAMLSAAVRYPVR